MGPLPRAAVFVLAAATAIVAPTTLVEVDAAACPTLANKGSTFMKSLAEMNDISDSSLSEIAASSVFTRADETMPFLTTCVASLDLKAILTQASTSTNLIKCMTALDNLLASTGERPTASDYKDDICPRYTDTIIPCVVDSLLSIATRAMSTSESGGCCDALTAKFTVWTGNDLKTTVTQLLQHIGNVACAQRTITATQTMEFCGRVIFNAVESAINATNDSGEQLSLFNMLQIPNEQVCNAMRGKAFVSTLGSSETLPIKSTDDIGRCFQPIDALVQFVRDFPLVKTYQLVKADGTTSVPLSNLFTAGECLKGNVLTEWLDQETNPVMLVFGMMDAFMQAQREYDDGYGPDDSISMVNSFGMLLKSIQSNAKAFCFHLPNSATCPAYNDETIVYPYTTTASTNLTGKSAASSAWSASAMAVALLAVSASALAIAARRT